MNEGGSAVGKSIGRAMRMTIATKSINSMKVMHLTDAPVL